MSSESLLQRMQHGGTQNANECLNSVIWVRCPKTFFVGKSKLEAAASMAISTFNEGASAMLSVMEVWLQSTVVMVNSMRETDMLRILKVTTASAKHRCKSLCTAKKVKRRQQELDEGPTYQAGMEN